MNIIVVGLGKVGQKITERLSREDGHNITVIDKRQERLKDVVNQFDVMGVSGSGASIDTLTEAGIGNADVLIAVTGSDELNMLTCLIAKKMGNVKTVARIRKPDYSKELHLIKEDLGLSLIINPEYTASDEVARILRFPSAIQIDTFAKGRVEILKFKIQEKSPLIDIRVRDLATKLNQNVLVCGVEREDKAFIPTGDFILRENDLVSIVASLENATQFFKTIGIKTNRVKNAMIVGGGETAVYLAKKLLKSGINVKIIEKDLLRCEELCSILPKADIINGDGTENRLLLEEGLENADSFVALTNMDEENILLSLYAKTKTDGKVVTKINRIAYDEVITHLGLDTTFYPKDITAEYIVRFVRAMNNTIDCDIETMHFILDGKAEALEFRIGENSPVVNTAIENLNLRENILVACITRNAQVITPRGKDVLMPGDTVIVVTTLKGVKSISDILK